MFFIFVLDEPRNLFSQQLSTMGTKCSCTVDNNVQVSEIIQYYRRMTM